MPPLDDLDRALIALLRDAGRATEAALQAETLEAFDRVLSTIRLFQGIANTETSLPLSTHKLRALQGKNMMAPTPRRRSRISLPAISTPAVPT